MSLSPWILPSSLAEVIALPNPFIMRMKRKGERGSPCLIPLEGENVPAGDPLRRIEKKAEETNDKIHLIQTWEKPKAIKIPHRNCQLALSKAFSMSNLMTMPGEEEVLRV